MSKTTISDTTHELVTDFKAAINMSALTLEKWLATEESQSVGQTRDGEHEAIGLSIRPSDH